MATAAASVTGPGSVTATNVPVLQLIQRFDQLLAYRLAERLAQLLIGLQRLAACQQRFSQREAALARQPQPLRSQIPLDQPMQRLNCRLRLPLQHVDDGQIAAQARQQLVESRRRQEALALEQLPHLLQRRARLLQLALMQPGNASNQPQDAAKARLRYVSPLREALGLAQPVIRIGKFMIARSQFGEADVAEKGVGIAAGFGFQPPLLIGLAGLFVQPLIRQQMPLQQLQPADDRTVPDRVAQRTQRLVEHADGALELASQFQQLDAIDAEHHLVQHAALEPRELHAFAVVMLSQLELALSHRVLGKRLQTQHALRPGMIGKHLERLQTVLARFGLTAQTRQEAAQRLPLRQQLDLPTRIGLREELGEFGQAVVDLVEPRGNDQCPPLQHDQSRGTGEQILRQLAAPLEKMRDVVADQQLLLPVTLQIVRRHLRLARPQRMLDCLAHIAAAGEPLTSTQMHLCRRRRLGETLKQQRKRSPQAKPFAAVVDLPHEQLEGLEYIEQIGAGAIEHVVAKLGGKARHSCQGEQCAPDILALALQHFALDVIAQQRRTGQQAFAQRLLIGVEQHQANARRPTFGARQQLLETVRGQLQPIGAQNLRQLLGRERERRGVELEQMPLQQQTRQLPRRLPPTVDPPADRIRSLLQQHIQTGVQSRANLARIIVEHDPERLANLPEQRNQLPLHIAVHDRKAQRRGQLGIQLLRRKESTAQVQPDQRGIGRHAAGTFAHQYRLAETSRCADQPQPAVRGKQGVGQSRPGNMRRRQTWNIRNLRLRRRGADRIGEEAYGHGNVSLIRIFSP